MWEAARGLLGRDYIDGALLVSHTQMVHTFGMRFAIDVVFCDRNLTVLHLATLKPWRLSRLVGHARYAIETEAGVTNNWAIGPGDRLTLEESPGGDLQDEHGHDSQHATRRGR